MQATLCVHHQTCVVYWPGHLFARTIKSRCGVLKPNCLTSCRHGGNMSHSKLTGVNGVLPKHLFAHGIENDHGAHGPHCIVVNQVRPICCSNSSGTTRYFVRRDRKGEKGKKNKVDGRMNKSIGGDPPSHETDTFNASFANSVRKVAKLIQERTTFGLLYFLYSDPDADNDRAGRMWVRVQKV